MQYNELKLMGYNVYASPVDTIATQFKEQTIINTINPHSYCTAKNDTLFSEALHGSDILLPDGSGIVLAAKVLSGETIPKIAGSDIHIHLLKELNKTGGRVFYLGASPGTLEKIKERLQREYPRITMGMYSPPYKNEFTPDDNKLMTEAVNAFAPDILFVGMTAPKQEKWVYRHKHELRAQVICSIGAVFDFFAGTRKRSGKIWIKLGLEWLPRLIREPRRMWKRNFVSTPCFLLDMMIARVFSRKANTKKRVIILNKK